MNLYLIDGNSYFYRAFHAIRGLTNSKGFPTNAIYGFTNMIMKIIREKKPDAIAIAFDSKEPTERHKIYEEYKAQRPETPNDLVLQIPYIKQIIKGFKIPAFEIPGYEADDIICTIAKKAASQGAQVFILSGDKDMMQAVGKGIKIYDPMKDLIIDESHVKERFGVPPERIPEFMAITGDAIDNIPGVKGIGEKTAKELLSKVSGLDELIEHPENIKNDRLRKMIADNIESIRISRTLATIDTNMPVDVNIHEMAMKEPDWTSLLRLFTEFEFKSLIKLVPSSGYKPRGQYKTIMDKDELMKALGI
ncbi:MAG: 5'-3' exonuclease H3TH domain-containing protein [Thermodesulfovibrionales bacterium]|nr:5'-3' exonuclease H3TH domain-containing protein [Thermodesulfovibrionales bacterium]